MFKVCLASLVSASPVTSSYLRRCHGHDRPPRLRPRQGDDRGRDRGEERAGRLRGDDGRLRGEAHDRLQGPQLRFIHIHRVFRIQHTFFELDTVNTDWWICIFGCLVQGPLRQGGRQGRPGGATPGDIATIITTMIAIITITSVTITIMIIVSAIIITIITGPPRMEDSVWPITVLRIRISEGLTRAES